MTFVVGKWDGRRTANLTFQQAREVLEDPAAPLNRKLLAEVQVFRIHEQGDEAHDYLRLLALRTDKVGEQARVHLRPR